MHSRFEKIGASIKSHTCIMCDLHANARPSVMNATTYIPSPDESIVLSFFFLFVKQDALPVCIENLQNTMILNTFMYTTIYRAEE